MKVVAVDPGLSGALAFIEVQDSTVVGLGVLDMPIIKLATRIIVDGGDVAAWLRGRQPDVCVVEQVGAMPHQGVVSMFSFGRALGTVEGVIHAAGLRLERVTPAIWQRATGASGLRDPRGRTLELMPRARGLLERKRDIGRADALLMAFWWAMRQGGLPAQ